jgi:hypothetical protein
MYVYLLEFYSLIKMDLQETGWAGTDWIDLTQDTDKCLALVNAVMNRRIP